MHAVEWQFNGSYNSIYIAKSTPVTHAVDWLSNGFQFTKAQVFLFSAY